MGQSRGGPRVGAGLQRQGDAATGRAMRAPRRSPSSAQLQRELRERIAERMDEILDDVQSDYRQIRANQIDPASIAAVLEADDGVTIVRLSDGRGLKIKGNYAEVVQKLETRSA